VLYLRYDSQRGDRGS